VKRPLAIALALAGLLISGCFVVDELDSGQAQMDHNSARGRPKPEEPAPRTRGGEDDGSIVDSGRDALASVEGWWDELGKPEPLPDDEIVQCRLHGSLQFTRESTCRARGGVPAGD
jgi:hypothetical protein